MVFLAACDVQSSHSTTQTITEQLVERYVVRLYQVHGADNRPTVLTYTHGVLSFVRFLVRRRWVPFSFDYQWLKITLHELTLQRQYRTPRVDVAGIAKALLAVTGADLPPRYRETSVLRRGHAYAASHQPVHVRRKRNGELESIPVRDRKPGTVAAHTIAARFTVPREWLNISRDRALLSVLWCTRMRREEACRLNCADIRDGACSEALIMGKGQRERRIYFDVATQTALQAYLGMRTDCYAPMFIRVDVARPSAPGPTGEGW